VGFREPATITLEFQPGDRYHGLEVCMQGMSIDAWMHASGSDGGEGEGAAETIQRFYKALISWNLTDANDQPVPVSDAPNRDSRMIRRLNNLWLEALTEVHSADPLPGSSTSGESSPAPAIPMAPLSESQAS
jgi:hypothetical protein